MAPGDLFQGPICLGKGPTRLENLTGELNASCIKYVKINWFFNTVAQTHLTSFWLKLCSDKYRITRHYSAELQTTTQTLRATKYSIESTYSDLPCYLKVNRDKLPLINRP